MAEKATGSPASFVDQSVVPGDVVLDLTSMANQTIKLGGGLRQDCDAITAMKAGTLKFSKPNKYWVETSQKRYVPCAGDSVLGIVADSKADNFLVDIKGPTIAFLPVLAFEGGTRRNIPKFEVGTLLYVRVVKANPGMNPELSCIDGWFSIFSFSFWDMLYMSIGVPCVLVLVNVASLDFCDYFLTMIEIFV
ncbi:unnamed protein product [Prunus armeniaca]